jgi:hypothetical protein
MKSIYTSQLHILWIVARLYQNSKMFQNSLESSWFCQVMSLVILWARNSHIQILMEDFSKEKM